MNPGNIDSATDLTWVSVNTTALGSQPSFAQVSTTVTTTARIRAYARSSEDLDNWGPVSEGNLMLIKL